MDFNIAPLKEAAKEYLRLKDRLEYSRRRLEVMKSEFSNDANNLEAYGDVLADRLQGYSVSGPEGKIITSQRSGKVCGPQWELKITQLVK